MENIKLPNFLLIGAPKSGTTSLYYYLNEHPQIFMSKLKEPHFFSKDCKQLPFKGPKDETLGSTKQMNLQWNDYIRLFEDSDNYKAVGEASADYLYYFDCINNIKKHLGNPKIIMILRNPVERAYSAYLHMIRDKREFLSFREALIEEKERKKKNWDFMWLYQDVGFYYKQVMAYKSNFENIKILLYEELKNDRYRLIKELYDFLGVNSNFVPNLKEKYNVGGIPKPWFRLFIQNNPLKNVLKNIVPQKTEEAIKKIGLKKPAMPLEDREYLIRIFKENILKLQNLIDMDLSHWLR